MFSAVLSCYAGELHTVISVCFGKFTTSKQPLVSVPRVQPKSSLTRLSRYLGSWSDSRSLQRTFGSYPPGACRTLPGPVTPLGYIKASSKRGRSSSDHWFTVTPVSNSNATKLPTWSKPVSPPPLRLALPTALFQTSDENNGSYSWTCSYSK